MKLFMIDSGRRRKLVDRIAAWCISIGGLSAIGVIILIFLFLFSEVLPLILPADTDELESYEQNWEDNRFAFILDEYGETGVRLDRNGNIQAFSVEGGEQLKELTTNREFYYSFYHSGPYFIAGADRGRVLFGQVQYRVSYTNDNRRLIEAEIVYPLGLQGLQLFDSGPVTRVSFSYSDDSLVLVGVQGNRIAVRKYDQEAMFLSDAVEWKLRDSLQVQTSVNGPVFTGGTDNRYLFVQGSATAIDIYDLQAEGRRHSIVNVVPFDRRITALNMLLGGTSLLVGDDQGQLSQWFVNRDAQGNESLQKVREFAALDASPVLGFVTEERRKGFVAYTANRLGLYYSTSNRRALDMPVQGLRSVVLNSRSSKLMTLTDEQVGVYALHNEHPDISMELLWSAVWYENYPEPGYIWQSSAATSDYEPKLSLVPLSFGTFKAAFYAMLISIPLGIACALYTATFMAPGMRRMIKPTIELMGSIPTVILGFWAGLVLAPYVEQNLPGIFSLLLILPLAIVVASLAHLWLPAGFKQWSGRGWLGLILVPVVLFACWVSLFISPYLEQWLFAGDMPGWIQNELGIGYDQRNALVVGLAMGFAVIPTIFSISEDAIFAVPKQLVSGSLALGASMWQTALRVVLLTASPGIFSSVMIGFGRAVGETMIVLMATGNTAILNFNIFEGMRTLSANIAVEMPESEVGSTHYRVLFLCALVLFAFTFILNTVAESVRHHLRTRYSSL